MKVDKQRGRGQGCVMRPPALLGDYLRTTAVIDTLVGSVGSRSLMLVAISRFAAAVVIVVKAIRTASSTLLQNVSSPPEVVGDRLAMLTVIVMVGRSSLLMSIASLLVVVRMPTNSLWVYLFL